MRGKTLTLWQRKRNAHPEKKNKYNAFPENGKTGEKLGRCSKLQKSVDFALVFQPMPCADFSELLFYQFVLFQKQVYFFPKHHFGTHMNTIVDNNSFPVHQNTIRESHRGKCI